MRRGRKPEQRRAVVAAGGDRRPEALPGTRPPLRKRQSRNDSNGPTSDSLILVTPKGPDTTRP
jgi:hypothetical protein